MIYVLGSTTVDMVAKVPYVPVSGETLRAEKFYSGVGGKGANQAVAVAKLGGSVKFIGKTGDDPNGRAVKEQLTASGVDTAHLGVSALPTATGMIMVINGDNRIVLSTGANFDFAEEDVDEGLADAKAGDYLVLQLEIPIETVVYAAEQAKKKKMTVILNPAPAASLPERLTENVDIICPNESETAILTGVEVKDELSLAAAVSALLRTGAKKAVITMGDKGAYIAEDGVITHIPARKVDAVDTTGAGDTFIGAMTLKLSEGENLEKACRFAAVASSIAVTREGAAAAIPTREETEKIQAQKS